MKTYLGRYSVVTPLVNISPSVSGVFDGEDDTYDPDRHEVRINLTPGTRLPHPAHYIDNAGGEQDSTLTPSNGGRITGSLLKFDPSDTDQGIFFVNTAGGSETRVDGNLMRNKPSELIFITPALSAGTYRLEVRSKLQNTTDIRTGNLSEQLTVS